MPLCSVDGAACRTLSWTRSTCAAAWAAWAGRPRRDLPAGEVPSGHHRPPDIPAHGGCTAGAPTGTPLCLPGAFTWPRHGAPGGVCGPAPQAGPPDPTARPGAALPGHGPEVLGPLAGTGQRWTSNGPRTSRAVWVLLCSGDAFISNSRSHYSQCQDLLNKISSVNPQTEIDGLQNIWIVKPAAKSRGRGESHGRGASPGPAGGRWERSRLGARVCGALVPEQRLSWCPGLWPALLVGQVFPPRSRAKRAAVFF